MLPTFTHGADGAPGLVGAAGDGAAAPGLLALGAGHRQRLAHVEALLGLAPIGRLPPPHGRRAGFSCGRRKR